MFDECLMTKIFDCIIGLFDRIRIKNPKEDIDAILCFIFWDGFVRI